jgi:hypothetical protein
MRREEATDPVTAALIGELDANRRPAADSE